MKYCIDVLPEEYHYDIDHHRYSVIPVLHFPDYCPYFGREEIGDCLAKCGDATIFERPCILKALDNET